MDSALCPVGRTAAQVHRVVTDLIDGGQHKTGDADNLVAFG
ncbi:hypothetical protein OHA62_11995 [Streptomyces sp. NBC_00343]